MKVRVAVKSVLALAALLLAGCGYHTPGANTVLPPTVHTIAVTPWASLGVQYKLPNLMAEALSRELLTSTRYKVVGNPNDADATLTGSIVNVISGASVADPVTGRSTGAQVIVRMQVRLTDKSGKVLFERPNLEFRERYELSINPGQYFDESEVALQRLSRDAARSVVSAILENF